MSKPTAAQKRRMDAVAKLPCLVCGGMPVQIHHCRHECGLAQRNHDHIAPLCPECHQHGPESRHGNSKAFAIQNGHDGFLHFCTMKLLGEI
jgi:hypothetical protein